MFRKPVEKAQKGDRVGIWVAKLDSKELERGLVCAPGKIKHFTIALAKVSRIRHYKGDIHSNMKYHVTLGHQTVLASCQFFYSTPEESKIESSKEVEAEDETFGIYGEITEEVKADVEYVYNSTHNYSDILPKKATKPGPPPEGILPYQARIYALIFFEHPIMWAPINSLLIGSKLDAEIEKNECRLAFCGNILETFDPELEE